MSLTYVPWKPELNQILFHSHHSDISRFQNEFFPHEPKSLTIVKLMLPQEIKVRYFWRTISHLIFSQWTFLFNIVQNWYGIIFNSILFKLNILNKLPFDICNLKMTMTIWKCLMDLTYHIDNWSLGNFINVCKYRKM